MIAHVYSNPVEGKVIIVKFVLNEDGLSVTSGALAAYGRSDFRLSGLHEVTKALVDYFGKIKSEASEFDKMPKDERRAFLKGNIGCSINERNSKLWRIDRLKVIENGLIPIPSGPPYRIEFNPSQGAEDFFNAIESITALNVDEEEPT